MRKAVHLTQQEFADRIGIRQNSIALIESGKRNTSNQVILTICREFNVNETWLRTGEGEMFLRRSRRDEIDDAVERLMSGETADFKCRFVAALASLDEKYWIAIEEKLGEIVNGKTDKPALPDYEAEARAEADEYYRQILAEKKAAARSLASSQAKDA